MRYSLTSLMWMINFDAEQETILVSDNKTLPKLCIPVLTNFVSREEQSMLRRQLWRSNFAEDVDDFSTVTTSSDVREGNLAEVVSICHPTLPVVQDGNRIIIACR